MNNEHRIKDEHDIKFLTFYALIKVYALPYWRLFTYYVGGYICVDLER